MERYIIERDGRIYSNHYKKYLTGYKNKKGYLRLSSGDLVHRLVAMKYIPNPNNYPQVDHINRNPCDNRVENLRWADNTINVSNRGTFKNNTSGHKWITKKNQRGRKSRWVFQRQYKGKLYQKVFDNKTDAICYKFIHLLKVS